MTIPTRKPISSPALVNRFSAFCLPARVDDCERRLRTTRLHFRASRNPPPIFVPIFVLILVPIFVNGKSAIEWIMDRYQVKTDKRSGITNDLNDWAEEAGNPRYILDLLLSMINL